MIISDDNVYPIYGEALTASTSADWECLSSRTAPRRNRPKISSLCLGSTTLLPQARLSRIDLVIALGGGVIGDLAGLHVYSFLRGIKLVQIPTSLLGTGGFFRRRKGCCRSATGQESGRCILSAIPGTDRSYSP